MFPDFCLPAAVKSVEALRLLTTLKGKHFRQSVVESDLNRNSHSKDNESKPGQIPELPNIAAASPEPVITRPI
jgi:hypothetical protein